MTSYLTALLTDKCPRCRIGSIHPTPLFSLKFAQQPVSCKHCGLHYEPETGFWWGAMYFTYGFGVAIFVTSYIAITLLVPKPTIELYMGTIIAALVLLYPPMLRYSRVLMLYFFGGVAYDPSYASGKART